MRISILTEGVSEFKSLPLLYPQLVQKMPKRSIILQPLKINVQPDAPYAQIVAACRPNLAIAKRRSDMIIVLLDREQQQDCPGEIAERLEAEFKRFLDTPVRVALKDRMYENWLVSDLEAIKSQPKRFVVENAVEKRVSPNKADSIDGLAELKRMVRNGQYSKTTDSERILKAASVDRIAQNSRSFRHFLHVLNYGTYQSGCRLPAQGHRQGTVRGARR